jgi:hypothetical protein
MKRTRNGGGGEQLGQSECITSKAIFFKAHSIYLAVTVGRSVSLKK